MRIVVKGGVWKNTEDEILKAAVMKYGKNNWARVASLLNRKSAKQCKARWYEWLDPSIRKIDWSREEEEKLLHLAKLMPNQWRTIAPIVGRTAGQCLEHYEQLLDRAQAVQGDAQDDPRKLRPGEIDPAPEGKPARPDPIDMDEDEKEMLQEARARLANTQGKKAKRKAREVQLDEARRLAMLQKRRELKAAGIESKLGGGKKRSRMDLATEIPFQRAVPAGFYDVGEEAHDGKKQRLDPRQAGYDMMEKEGRREAEQAERAKRQENTKMKRLFKENAPAAILKIAQENDPAALRRRSALSLPAPQVGDAELEEIVKQGQKARAAGVGGMLMPPPTGGLSSSSHAAALMGEYRGPRALPTPMRTPLQEDTLRQEALNQRALRGMGPLTGEELPELYQGTGFEGTQPRRASAATPNTVLGTPRSVASFGATPLSLAGGNGGQGGQGGVRQTPLRDDLGLNDQADGFSVTEDGQSVASTAFSEAARERRMQLLQQLQGLPEPEFSYEVSLPAAPAEEDEAAQRPQQRADAADMALKQRQRRAEEEALKLARRSATVQRALPRPPAQLPLHNAARLAAPSCCEASACEDVSPAILLAASEMVNREMLLLLAHDQCAHPCEGSSRVPKNNAALGPSTPRHSSVPELEALSDVLLQQARHSVAEEARALMRADPALAALPSDEARAERAHEALAAAWAVCTQGRTFVPSLGRAALPATALSMQEARAASFAALRQRAEADGARAGKLEARLEALTQGLQKRAAGAEAVLAAAFAGLQQRSTERVCFEKCREHEGRAVQARLQAARQEAEQACQVERKLQQEYAAC